MLQWNELRITPDGKHLIVDVEVQPLDFYKNVYIKSIEFNTFNKATDYKEYPNSGTIKIKQDSTPKKHVRQVVDIDTLSKGILFVYAVADGTPTEDTPCGAKEPVLLGIVYNKALLHNMSINMLSTMDNCNPSKAFIDYILRTKAFELSLESGDYKTAIGYWESFFDKKPITYINCNCHG